MVEFYLFTVYKAIELLLLFWLLGLLFKWILTFVFGDKGARIIGFIGYVPNFAIKKFVLKRIFKIDVSECDPYKLKFSHEETDRWDILFTALVLCPMSIGLFLGSILGSIGLLLENNLVVLSIFFYICGFLTAVNSIPSFQDIKELKDCSVRSIVIWFLIATIICAILAAVLIPLLESLGVLLTFIIGFLGTTIITFFIPFVSEKMNSEKSSSLTSGIVDLDG